MWGKIRALVGDGADAGKLVTADCDRSDINAPDATSPYAAVAGRYFHLGESVYMGPHGLGLAAKRGSGDEFKTSVKKLTSLASQPLDFSAHRFGHLEGEFADNARRLLASFEATYVGRRVSGGRRRPLFDTAWWEVESRMRAGSLRTNNDVEAPRNAIASSEVHDGIPQLGRFVESARLQQNRNFGETVSV